MFINLINTSITPAHQNGAEKGSCEDQESTDLQTGVVKGASGSGRCVKQLVNHLAHLVNLVLDVLLGVLGERHIAIPARGKEEKPVTSSRHYMEPRLQDLAFWREAALLPPAPCPFPEG